jgi:hypothetical protein
VDYFKSFFMNFEFKLRKTVKLLKSVSLLYSFHFKFNLVRFHTKCLGVAACIHSVIRFQNSLPHDIHKIACLLKLSGVQYFIFSHEILYGVLEGTTHTKYFLLLKRSWKYRQHVNSVRNLIQYSPICY